MRRRAMRRSLSSCDSPGPRVPTPPPRRSRCCHMPRMRGRLYSSCASSTWSFPSALTACWAKMSRISWVRSTTRAESAFSSVRCCTGSSSSSTSSTIPSESRHEAVVREHLLELIPEGYAAEFAGDEAFLFAPVQRRDVPLVVLAGHYDTVPAQDNVPGRITDGAVHGLGAADMKGGVAVALELVRDIAAGASSTVDVAFLLFGREELPAQF